MNSFIPPELLLFLHQKFGLEEKDFIFERAYQKYGLVGMDLHIPKYDISVHWDQYSDRHEDDKKKLQDDERLCQRLKVDVCQRIKASVPYAQEKRKENKRLIKELLKRVSTLEEKLLVDKC
ncbi:hypothetical protein D1R32_gp458 [Tunisvirus fontaine2]|uniref:Uncharacterized protein n=1 Tax=Tunisvirus fontaine2 TaxID=1421067 RepID=V9SEM3_9VIRU|nr:hypothetical protein D1R32_gp458 [Tunisvirus fontaine2]AHC55175.1 hypothetical protein TNS_ORF457 [Tunisvirus fontaine2]